MNARRLGNVGWSVVAVVIALVWAFPVYWMLNSSLLPNAVLNESTPRLLPFGGSLDNYRRVLSGGRFFDALWMSLGVTVATVAERWLVMIRKAARRDDEEECIRHPPDAK